jgi:hypothetical protein
MSKLGAFVRRERESTGRLAFLVAAGILLSRVVGLVDKQCVIRQDFIGSRSEAKLRQAIQAVVAANYRDLSARDRSRAGG